MAKPRTVTERIADIISVHGEANSMIAAEEIMENHVVNAHFENKFANDQVRRLRSEHRCPCCGADEA